MEFIRHTNLPIRGCAVLFVGAVLVVSAACSSSTTATTSDAGGGGGGATCASPGAPTPGTADNHCQGVAPQTVTASSCTVTDAGTPDDSDGGADGGAPVDTCDYGMTMFGLEGDDDDCKYHVTWKSDPICEGAAGVSVTVTVVNLVAGADGPAGSPVKNIPMGVLPEVFIPTSTTAACDNASTHPSPSANPLVETPAGSGIYKGALVFDAPGQWTVRFHIHEECADVLDDSQHGHAAFRVTVP